jgi:hypothetical protein
MRNTPAESATERCERCLTPNASFKRATHVEGATVAGPQVELNGLGIYGDRQLKTKNLGRLWPPEVLKDQLD